MINSVLMAAAIPHQEAQYPDPPTGTYAVYLDGIDADGADGSVAVLGHNCTIELYAPTIQAGNEDRARLLAELETRGVHYTTQGWYWMKELLRYQEVITFNYYKKL